jgi:hypothetical protein
MSISLQVLHVPDCPNLAPMLERLRQATDLPVAVRGLATDHAAAAAGMHGSPTLLIDGRDPFAHPDPTDRGFGLACRIYRDEHGRAVPAPSVAQLQDAITVASRTNPLTRLTGSFLSTPKSESVFEKRRRVSVTATAV